MLLIHLIQSMTLCHYINHKLRIRLSSRCSHLAISNALSKYTKLTYYLSNLTKILACCHEIIFEATGRPRFQYSESKAFSTLKTQILLLVLKMGSILTIPKIALKIQGYIPENLAFCTRLDL